MPTMKEVKEKLDFDSYSLKNGVFTVRKGFFYTMGKTSQDYVNQVERTFPSAKILDHDEIWKAFRGGANLANQSHFYVKFTFEEK